MPKFSTLLFLLLISAQLDATIYFELNRQVVESYQKAISLDYTGFEKAQEILKQTQPSNGMVLLLENYKDMIRLLIDENPVDYRESLGARNQRLSNLELADKNSPFYYYCLSECYLHWSIIRIRYNDHARGANDLRKAAAYLSKGQSAYPQFYMFLKPAAMISAMASAVPENYKWLSKLAGVSGSMKEANAQLDNLIGKIQLAKTFSFVEDELKFIKIFIAQNLMQKDELAGLEMRSENPLLQFAQIWQASKRQQSSLILEKIPELKARIQGLDFCYLDYLKAEAELNLLRNPVKSLSKFIQCTNGQAFLKAAHRKLAWYYFIQKDTALYLTEMKLVEKVGSSYTDDDKQALDEAKSNILPNSSLLKARLLFDGGMFKESISLLDSNFVNYKSPASRSEYYYRKGRAYQSIRELQKAKASFKNSIIIGENLPLYFAASSSYQLAIILLSENDREGAEYYFKKVSRYPKHAYKTSMDMKAAAQLSNNF